MTTKPEIRRLAKGNVYALLDVALATADGDLWVDTDHLSEAGLDEFVAEVRRIRDRIYR